jgi:hypothetical protein
VIKIEKNEIGRACRPYGGGERLVQGIVDKACDKWIGSVTV